MSHSRDMAISVLQGPIAISTIYTYSKNHQTYFLCSQGIYRIDRTKNHDLWIGWSRDIA